MVHPPFSMARFPWFIFLQIPLGLSHWMYPMYMIYDQHVLAIERKTVYKNHHHKDQNCRQATWWFTQIDWPISPNSYLHSELHSLFLWGISIQTANPWLTKPPISIKTFKTTIFWEMKAHFPGSLVLASPKSLQNCHRGEWWFRILGHPVFQNKKLWSWIQVWNNGKLILFCIFAGLNYYSIWNHPPVESLPRKPICQPFERWANAKRAPRKAGTWRLRNGPSMVGLCCVK